MKLFLQIKLLLDESQRQSLIKTLVEVNKACNFLNEIAIARNTFNRFKLHHYAYYDIKNSFNLCSNATLAVIGKVAGAYKKIGSSRSRAIKKFNLLGGVSMHRELVTYSKRRENIVSIWTVDGRIKAPFICYKPELFKNRSGEPTLTYCKGKFYLLQTIEAVEELPISTNSFIGVDFGLTDIAITSEGQKFSSKQLNNYRAHRVKIRISLQRKGTKGSKRLLKRLKGRERRTATIINHTIAKQIVGQAKLLGKGISVEDLRGIQKSNKRGKKFKARLGNWSYFQLKKFIEYKAKLLGLPFIVVAPAFTSQTCHRCKHIGKRSGKSFKCENCEVILDADENAAKNIALLGAFVNCPEESELWGCTLQF